MSRPLVLGRTGQGAQELAAPVPEARFLGRDEADLTDLAAYAAVSCVTAPTAVINAATYTVIDRAENDAEATLLVNRMARTIRVLIARSSSYRAAPA